jgi:hypothetical protein
MTNSVKFLFIYRGYIQINTQFVPIRFDSWVRRVDPHQNYQCVALASHEVYEVLGANIFDYFLYNMRPLTKSDPEYIRQLPLQQQTDYNI